MASEQQSTGAGAGATPAVAPQYGSIDRSRSGRLADHAATAALYVTHPDRRLSVREPAMAVDTQLLRDSTATADWRLDHSHASASAALAHARSKPFEVWRPAAQPAAERAAFHARGYRAPDAIYVAQPTPEGHKAATYAIRDRRSVTSFPPPSRGLDISEPDQTANLQRRASEHDKALRAATGAFNRSRRRATTGPDEPGPVSQPLAASAAGASRETTAEPTEAPLEHLDSAMEASRVQHMANADRRLFTSSPPVDVGREEQNKRNVQRAAVVSMARDDMYDVTEAKGEEQLGPAVFAAQRGLGRARSQRTPKVDSRALQQAISLQEAAQKRAQEKLATMHDETAAYQEYYGTAPQPTRSGLSTRRRRASSDTDVEQSKEIRKQMTSLRTQLNEVDEQRDKDRSFLMEAARKNVNAAIQNMEQRVYTDTGRVPASTQREWEEVAEERARQEQQEAEAQYPERVNIGAERYVDMADVEALARSRVQPTLDEMNDYAEKQKAKETEERLDEERRRRLQSVERQREADLKAEEKRLNESLKHGDKPDRRRFSKRSKRGRSKERPAEKAEETEKAKEAKKVEKVEATGAAPARETPEAPAETPSTEDMPEMGPPEMAPAQAAGGPVVSGAAPKEAPKEAPPKPESKLRNWFKSRRRAGRRSSGNVADQPAKPSNQQATTRETTRETTRAASTTEGGAPSSRNDSRGQALSSHPITGDELTDMQRRRSVASTAEEGSESATNGKRSSRMRSSLMKMVSRNNHEAKANGASNHEGTSRRASEVAEPSQARRTSNVDRGELRDSAVEQGLPVPPNIGKQASNGTARESRFSEDL